MDLLSFLFLQIFIVRTSGLYVDVMRILDEEEEDKKVNKNFFENIDYDPKTILDDEEAYLFTRIENGRLDMIYWLGARTKLFKKMNALNCVAASRHSYTVRIPTEILYITRETPRPGIKTFEDLMSAKVPRKIPRLYKVIEGQTIRQVPLKSNLDIKNSYVLDDGSSVTIYHSSTCETKRKIANLLAAYIINVENGGNYNLDPSGDEESSEIAFNKFRNKISSIGVLLNNEMGSSEAVSEKSKIKNKNPTKKDNKYFLDSMITTFAYLHVYQIPINTDSTNRISNTTATSSTSTAATRANCRKKSKAAKGKTSFKVTKNTSLFESESSNTAASSIASDSGNNKYENLIPIFMGSEECVPKPQPLPIDTLKLMCIYMLKDLENYEIFIYLGTDVDFLRQRTALRLAELEIYENSKWKTTIVLPGNAIPAAFMIHIESEVERYLMEKN